MLLTIDSLAEETDERLRLACHPLELADQRAVAETARVLRPGGRYAFSITHPTRWMFPDDPTTEGLTASQSYWDRTPYVEVDDETGATSYVEHHRTLGDWVRLLARQGFSLQDLVEPGAYVLDLGAGSGVLAIGAIGLGGSAVVSIYQRADR